MMDKDMNDELSLFTLRAVKASDLPVMLELYRQCEDFLALGPCPTATLEMVTTDFNHSLAEGSRYCAIVLPAGEVAGVVDYKPSGFQGKLTCGFIELLMIAAPYRMHGLGALVVKRVEDGIRANPAVTEIRSAVQVNNPKAVRFWQRAGYAIASPAEKQADGTVTYALLKKL
jgi:ribosomal protein S18 acetylase RimI-like enzyme